MEKISTYEAIWFTGQSGAGKTVLGQRLKNYLSEKNPQHKYVIIDGDDIREMFENKDYSAEGRLKNVKFVQDLCGFLIKNNIKPIVSMVSPNLTQRENFKSKYKVLEIFISCNEMRGREHFHVDYYEAPRMNFISLDSSYKEVEDTFQELLKVGI